MESVAQVEDGAVGSKAADEIMARRDRDGMTLGADRDFAVVARRGRECADSRRKATKETSAWANDRLFFAQGLGPRSLRRDAQFTMDLMLVNVRLELIDQAVGVFQIEDFIGLQQRRQSLLPIIVAPLDFALGLWRGRKAQGHGHRSSKPSGRLD